MFSRYREQGYKLRLYEEIFTVFNQLREADELCDVTLIAEGKHLKAHRNVLSAGSPYFRKMFTSSMLETKMEEVNIPDISYETMEQVIEFIYTSKARLTTENAQNVLIAANFLQMLSLLEICGKYIVKQIDATNCFVMRELFITTNCDEKIIASASDYINKNFSRISYNDSFLQLDINSVVELLSSNELCCSSEEDVFHGAIRWLQTGRDRKRYSEQVSNCLRLSLLTDTFNSKYIDNNQLFSRSSSGKSIEACDDPRTLKTSLLAFNKDKNSLHTYNSRTKQWTKFMDIKKKKYNSVATGGKYIFLSGETERSSCKYFINCMNLETKKLTSLPPHPEEFNTSSEFKMIVVGWQLYLFREKQNVDNGEYTYCLHWAVYDLEKAIWNELELIFTSCLPSCVAVGENIYLLDTLGKDTKVRKLDTKTQKWSHVTLMTEQDYCWLMETYKEKIYFAESFSGGVNCQNLWNVYNPATNEIKQLAPFIDSEAFNIKATSDGIYALKSSYVGGKREPPTEIDFYDVENEEWRFEGVFPNELNGLILSTIPNMYCEQ